MKVLVFLVIAYFTAAYFLSWVPFTRYDLHKFYRQNGAWAGIVETFSSELECLDTKADVEEDDKRIGYTNSRFVCEKR